MTAPRTLTTLNVAGDWHGNTAWAIRCLDHLATLGIREVFHLGDFGIWPGPSGRAYVRAVQQRLDRHEMILLVTPGNHEDYEQIDALPALDLGHDVGAVPWLTDRIAILPRNHRMIRNGWSIASLGGAPSIDIQYRVPGRDWWIGEAITPDDVAAFETTGPCDVMLTHDSPDADYTTAAVGRIVANNPLGYENKVLQYCAVGRQRLTQAFLAGQPRVLAHGHYHVRDQRTFRLPEWDHDTLVISTDCDGNPDGNLAQLRLHPTDEPTADWIHVPGAGTA